MIFSSEQIKGLDKRFRANLINSLLGYKPANLVGTISEDGVPNLAVFNSAIHLGASPPLIGLLSRPDTVERHTLSNIKSTDYYTINHINSSMYRQAHQSSAKYAAGVSEFTEVGLTPKFIEGVSVPFVEESEVKILVHKREIIPFQINGTIMIIGEILSIDVADAFILEDGSLAYDQLKTVAVTGLDTYHKSKILSKLSYARP